MELLKTFQVSHATLLAFQCNCVLLTDTLTRMGVTVIGQEFNVDDTDHADTPLEIVQMMKGITTVGDHMRQKVMEILHVSPPTKSVAEVK